MKSLLRKAAIRQLPEGYAVDTHFSPAYNPWDQRMCLVPDGDLFTAIRDGRASVVTDRVDTFTESGIRLQSGARTRGRHHRHRHRPELAGRWRNAHRGRRPRRRAVKDSLLQGNDALGCAELRVDDRLHQRVVDTQADLVAEYVCRLLNHMDAHNHAAVTPNASGATATNPFLNLASGYVQRSVEDLPKQGDRAPWRLHQNYVRDVRLLRRGPIDDDVIFTPAVAARSASVKSIA